MPPDPRRSAMPPERDDVLSWSALALLVVLTGWARTVGIGFELPTSFVGDESVYVQHMSAFANGSAAHADAGWYPHLVSRIAQATWSESTDRGTSVADLVARASALQQHVRSVVAFLSLIAIPATWFLVRAFASRATALLAAALVATSLFAQVLGQQGRPHAAALGFGVLALALAVRLSRHPTIALALAAGVSTALAFATLQSGLAVLPSVLVAIATVRGVSRRARVGLAVASVAPIAAALVLAYPFLFVGRIDPEVQRGHGLLGEGRFGLDMLDGSGFAVLADALWTYEPIAVITCVAAAAIATASAMRGGARSGPRTTAWDPRTWSDRARSYAVVASYVVPYVVTFGVYERTYPRYALALVPFVAWCAASALTPTRESARSLRAWIPAAIVLVAQSVLVAKLAIVRSRPCTMHLAAEWIDRELPRSARIGLPSNDDLPLLRGPTQRAAIARGIAPRRAWLGMQAELGVGPWDEHARDLTTIREIEPNRVVDAIRDSGVEYFVWRTYGDPRRSGIARVREDLAREAVLVATFRPTDDGDPTAFVPPEGRESVPRTRPWIERLLRADAVGHVVEVWKLDAAR